VKLKQAVPPFWCESEVCCEVIKVLFVKNLNAYSLWAES
jgi:hypothetical protein